MKRQTTVLTTRSDVPATAPPSPPSADGAAHRLRTAMTSFEEVRVLLTSYVTCTDVEIVVVVEADGHTSSATSCAATPKRPARALRRNARPVRPRFATFEEDRNRATEQVVEAVLAAEGFDPATTHVVYTTRATSRRERLTVAFAFRAILPDVAEGRLTTRTLANCFIYVCLQHCFASRDIDAYLGLSSDLIPRGACQMLVQQVARTWTRRENPMLYRLCCDIAGSQYEGRSGSGSFVFLRRGDRDEAVMIRFREPIHATNAFGARKLMAMATGDFALLFDGDYFWGFASLAGLIDLPHVTFEGNGLWSLVVGGAQACLVSFGKPVPPTRILHEADFRAHLRRCFPAITAAGIDRIWQIAAVATGQNVGTNILFTPQAASEAQRLASQCIRIDAVELTPEMTMHLTAIDGTVIADTDGAAHAVGAIMDGPSTVNGTWQRGGRYNSAANYVANAGFPALILIVSQDGYVDIVPPIERKGDKWQQSRYLRLSSIAT
jgi:hypothetical protein